MRDPSGETLGDHQGICRIDKTRPICICAFRGRPSRVSNPTKCLSISRASVELTPPHGGYYRLSFIVPGQMGPVKINPDVSDP
jgi:hypothetical protein